MSLLSADSSPGGLITGVRKANKKPLMIMAVVGTIILLVLASVAVQRQERAAGMGADKPLEEKPSSPATTSTLLNLEKVYGASGEISAAGDPPVLPITPEVDDLSDTGLVSGTATETVLHQPTEKETELQGRPLQYQQQLEQFSNSKLRLFEAALTTKSSIEVPKPQEAIANYSQDSTGQKLEQLRQRIAASGQSATYADRLAAVQSIQAPQSGEETYQDEVSNEPGSIKFGASSDDDWTLSSRLQRPLTPYVIRTGFVIPGIMVGGINSDLPGEIKGQVSQTVYDTATGRFPLIPQGSILTGLYNSDIAFGQERVQVAWQRIVYPDGRALNIGGMSGADSGGYSGLHDLVNHHWGRIFGAALAMSVISAGYTLSQDNNEDSDDNQSASSALSESLGQQLGQTGMQITQKNLAIQPTNLIRPGKRFNVMINKDIVFDSPYAAFNY